MIMRIKTKDLIGSDLWRLFPVINVDRSKDIPADYPGAMGVPITFLDKLNPEQFELLDSIRPTINGKALYQRLIVRNLKPDLPEEIDIIGLLQRTGIDPEVVLIGGDNLKGLCAARKAASCTQTQLAEKLGISQTAVAKWETGRAYPRSDILPAIAETLGCSIDDLFADPGGDNASIARKEELSHAR